MEIWTAVLAAAAAITTLGGAITMISKGAKPVARVVHRIEALEEHEKKDLERFENIDIELGKLNSTNQAIMSALFALLSHAMTNNDTGKMQDALNKLQKHLIEH